MIHAEVSVYPLATKTSSISFYVAKAVEAAREAGVACEVGPMGTVLEAKDMATVSRAVDAMLEAVHSLGVSRAEIIVKVDSRRDKDATLQGKVDAVRGHLEPP